MLDELPVSWILKLSLNFKTEFCLLWLRLRFKHLDYQLYDLIGIEDRRFDFEESFAYGSKIKQIIDEAKKHSDLVFDQIHYSIRFLLLTLSRLVFHLNHQVDEGLNSTERRPHLMWNSWSEILHLSDSIFLLFYYSMRY